MNQEAKKELKKWAEDNAADAPFYDTSSNVNLIRSLLRLAIEGERGFDDEDAWSTISALKNALEWFEETVEKYIDVKPELMI